MKRERIESILRLRGETILNFSNKAKYDYIVEYKIAIRNQIKIIKFHSASENMKMAAKHVRTMNNQANASFW